jgi:hypothetical protein
MKQQSAAQGRKHTSPDAAVKDQAVRTFTSDKLTWQDCLCAVATLPPAAFKVGRCISQAVNHKTMETFRLSDRAIADKTGLSERTVRRMKHLLRDAGWIVWRRTASANIYRTLDQHLNAVIDDQLLRREARKAAPRRDRPKPVKPAKPAPCTRPTVAACTHPHPANVGRLHPANRGRQTPLSTPSEVKRPASANSVVEEDTGPSDAAKFYFVDAAFDPADIPEPPPHQSIPDLVDVDDPGARQARRAGIFAQAHATLAAAGLRELDPDPDPEPDEEVDEDDLADDDDGAPSWTPRTPRQHKDGEFEGAVS